MSQPDDDQAGDMLADLKSRGFRICEFVPKADATYLEGADAKEWLPISDRRSEQLIAMLLIAEAGCQ